MFAKSARVNIRTNRWWLKVVLLADIHKEMFDNTPKFVFDLETKDFIKRVYP